MPVVKTSVGWIQTDESAAMGDNGNIGYAGRTFGLDVQSHYLYGKPQHRGDYDTFRFTDTLQADAPVIITLTYFGLDTGFTVGPGASYILEVGFEGGTTGPIVGLVPTGGNGSRDAGLGGAQDPYPDSADVYISGDTNRLAVAIGEGPNLYANLCFNVERTKDVDGNDTTEGIIFQWMQSNGQYIYYPLNGGPSPIGNMVIPNGGTVAGYNTSLITPVNQTTRTLSHAGSIGALAITPFNVRPYYVGLGWQLYYTTDFAAYSPIIIPIYGVDHTYLPLNQGEYMQHTNPRASTSLMMRWE